MEHQPRLEQELRETVAALRRAQAELEWKTAFFEAEANASLDGIIVVDDQGRKILQNQRAADLLKIPRHIAEAEDDGEQVRWVTDMIINPEQFFAKVSHLYAHPDEISRDEIELKDGTLLDRYSSPVVGKNGKYYGRIWTFRDITVDRRTADESKQAKIAAVLREGAQRYNFLTETVPLIIWTARPDGGVDYFNKAWFDYTGLTLAQSGDWGWSGVVHADDLPRCIERWTHSFTTGENYEIQYRFKRGSDATYRWFLGRASARRTGAGEIVQWVGTCTDIDDQKCARAELESQVERRTAELARVNEDLRVENAERKRMAESLRESNEKFQSLVDNITDVFWIRSADMRELLYISPAFERIWGRSVKSLYAHPEAWADFILPEDRDRVVGAFATLTGATRTLEAEYRIQRPDGEMRWVRVRAFQVRNAAGELIHHTGIVTDITERKRLEMQLFQSQKMEIVGKLAGGFAHEFNSILTAIIGQSELLLADLPAGSQPAAGAVAIRNAAGRAATLTRQLLAYGRKQILRPEILDLNIVLTGMENTLRHLVGRSTEVIIVPVSGLKPVKADAGQIEQVIMNMAINAHEAMPNGGKLTLETANVSFGEESLGGYRELNAGGYVMLGISDSGTGMNAQVMARVFEPFFSTKGVGQGTGLGLSTCYGIIKQSGGHISVYSEPGRGTVFKIYLPRVEPEKEAAIPRLDPPSLPTGTETILLVEDDPALREMEATLLRRLGYTVHIGANGIEALSIKQQRDVGHIDLLFTDVVMPHMSGKELADRVRASSPLTRILFASAYTENANVHQGALEKGVAMLQKPFAPSELAHKIRKILDERN